MNNLSTADIFEIQDMIREAVNKSIEAERERIADIIENTETHFIGGFFDWDETSLEIAKKIRSGVSQ
jgi:hypothetical protein